MKNRGTNIFRNTSKRLPVNTVKFLGRFEPLTDLRKVIIQAAAVNKCRSVSPASYKALRTYMSLDLKYGVCDSSAEDVCTWYIVSEHAG
jgi:hypothetical protein